MWQRGKPRAYTNGKLKDDNKVYDMSGKTPLNPDIISLISISPLFIQEYARKYYVKGQLHQTVRVYSDSHLERIPILLGDREGSSLKVDELKEYYKDHLIKTCIT